MLKKGNQVSMPIKIQKYRAKVLLIPKWASAQAQVSTSPPSDYEHCIFLPYNWEEFTHYYLCSLDLARWYLRTQQLQIGFANISN